MLLLPLLLLVATASFETSVFVDGEDGYACYNIPSVVFHSPTSKLIAFAEGRKYNCSDRGYVDIVYKTSNDNGTNWSVQNHIIQNTNNTTQYVTTYGDTCPVVDSNGDVHLIFMVNNTWVFRTRSRDAGTTWESATNITSHTKPSSWGAFMGTGHAGGTLLPGGRLVVPAYSAETSFVMISDTLGQTWYHSSMVGGGGEAQVVVLDNSTLLMNMRNNDRKAIPNYRYYSTSTDMGLTWSAPVHNSLTSPLWGCEGSTVSGGEGVLYYTGPSNPLWRSDLVLRKSADQGRTWSIVLTIWEKAAGYSSMVYSKKKNMLYVLYARNNKSSIVFQSGGLFLSTFKTFGQRGLL